MVCDSKIRKVKGTKRKFVPIGKIWELHEDSVKSDFRHYINNYRPSSQKGYWNVLKVFLKATDKSYG